VDERPAGRGEREAPSSELVLAAVERAMRHRLPAPGPTPMWLLLEHLAIPRRSGAARRLAPLLAQLERAGLLARGRAHGAPVWSLTPAGRRALDRAAGEELPESPRHRAWRHARTAASQELPRFRAALATTLAATELMLAADGGEAPTAEDWLAAGRALAGDCRRLASAWHCLHEWDEPDDDGGERVRDPARRAELAALRNVRLWRERD
jgi:hypothetical protein